MKPIVFLLALAAICGGCVSTYTANSVSRSTQLSTNATALIALPEDGHFEKIPYPGSGHKTALAVSKAFAKHLPRVDMTPEAGSLSQHLEQGRAEKFDYLVIPTVVHWKIAQRNGRAGRIGLKSRFALWKLTAAKRWRSEASRVKANGRPWAATCRKICWLRHWEFMSIGFSRRLELRCHCPKSHCTISLFSHRKRRANSPRGLPSNQNIALKSQVQKPDALASIGQGFPG